MSTEAVPRNLEKDEDPFTFAERAKKASVKSILKRPVTVAATLLVIAVGALIAYLEEGSIEIDLSVPRVSYSLLPNEGRTSGVPIAIKLNQIAVFMINDPLEGGEGAARAKKIVAQVQEAVTAAVSEKGQSLSIDNDAGPMPRIVLAKKDNTEKKVLVELTPEDLLLAGDPEAKRVARVWAERLTDTVKVLGFAEPPKFSTGTAFGDALKALYTAAVTPKGIISKSSLDAAFEALPARRKLALETLPTLNPEPKAAPEESGQ